MRLIKKFAEMIDGIDLRAYRRGDTLDLSRSDARSLIAEGWAVRDHSRRYMTAGADGASPADSAADRRKGRHG